MPVFAFDLGNTLVEYAGLPLSWEAHYDAALDSFAQYLGVALDSSQRAAGQAILRRYNTRLNPREREIAFTEIAAAMADELHVAAPADPLAGARTFFRVFQQQLRVFPDAIPTLRALRERGQPIGVFTDVPYGMPRALVVDDVAATGLTALIDVLITSGDAGWRKPSPQSLRALADALGCEVTGLVYVGDERKDIAAALASGCRSVLLDRAGVAPAWGQHATVRNLQELLTLT